MDVKEIGRLLRREECASPGRFRLRTTGGDRRARLELPMMSAGVLMSRVTLLRRRLGGDPFELELLWFRHVRRV